MNINFYWAHNTINNMTLLFPEVLKHCVSSNLLKIVFLHNCYLCHIFSFYKSPPVSLFWKDSLARLHMWIWGCIKQLPVKPRKQIKIWLWGISAVRHNSRMRQIRPFLFPWGDSHCQAWKWWSVGCCEKKLMHLEF